jgi:hypothetical protein
MRPVLVLRHAEIETPGYLASYLDGQSIPWQVRASEDADRHRLKYELREG